MDTDHDVILVWEKLFCLRRPRYFFVRKAILEAVLILEAKRVGDVMI
jgi:hypothetical protein